VTASLVRALSLLDFSIKAAYKLAQAIWQWRL